MNIYIHYIALIKKQSSLINTLLYLYFTTFFIKENPYKVVYLKEIRVQNSPNLCSKVNPKRETAATHKEKIVEEAHLKCQNKNKRRK